MRVVIKGVSGGLVQEVESQLQMMLAKVESGGKKNSSSSSDKRLLHDIEAISQALYLNKCPSKGGSVPASDNNRSKSAGKARYPDTKLKSRTVKEDKKPSIWNWKPLKALAPNRSRRFNCCFSLEVHAIEGLSLNFDDTSLCVHWKRRDETTQTSPSKVLLGVAKFEETLLHRCFVNGSASGPNHSAKYDAKHSMLFVSMVGYPALDLGKHQIDLTRLLPLNLEELEEEKSSGKWTTSYKLSGKGKGASLNVSFGYMIVGDDQVETRGNRNPPVALNVKQNRPSTTRSVTGLGIRDGQKLLVRAGSLPTTPNERSHHSSQSVEDVKILHEVLPSSRLDLSTSVSLPCSESDEGMVTAALNDSKTEPEVFSEQNDLLKPNSHPLYECMKGCSGDECEIPEFTVIEHGIEMCEKEEVKLEEGTVDLDDGTGVKSSEEHDNISTGDGISPGKDMTNIPQSDDYSSDKEEYFLDDISSKENNIVTKESIMEELDSAFQSLSMFTSEGFESPPSKGDFLEEANYMEYKSTYKTSRSGKSLSFDDASSDTVASEFLAMLGIEHSPFGVSSESEPDSPRERLLRQFEKEALSGGLFDFDMGKGEVAEFGYSVPTGSGFGDSSLDFELPPVVQPAEAGHHGNKTSAKMLEDLETEALMREWGLNEKSFQHSPPNSAGGFGSPIHLPPEDFALPPLAEGLGPFVQTKDGGFLRSMNPSLFKNTKNVGNLIMQVSSPVVVPAEMGSGIMDILQGLASIGIEKLSMQANKLMPLEDITGKTMQQISWEAAPCLEAAERQVLMHHEPGLGQDGPGNKKKKKAKGGSSGHGSNSTLSSFSKESCSEYVNLEDLAPLAMDKIEALSIEGLRIQSGMSDEEAPSNISPQAIGEISALAGKRANLDGSLGLEGAGGLQLLDIKDGDNDVDGVMGLSITLDEWMKLDSGMIRDEDDQISERTSKILAAHHASSTELFNGGGRGEKKKGKGKKCGLLGNNFTVALMVQLRDPLRNYEPVGTPMLALIQVERVFVPPKPRLYVTVSENPKNEDDDDETATIVEVLKDDKKEEKKEVEEEVIPQFKITEVHVAGLKTDPGKKKPWGSKSQQQSGSRWLLASGMGKSNKNPLMKSKVVAKSSAPQVTTTATVQPGDTLWSISSRVHGDGSKWKDLAKLNPHIRNPNVIFPNETIRLR
ncbi:hypothetical protein MKW98_006223 [Papaver atlanticum]|uniref:Uncharacterized protein n=1 Tax=Papaver atlanticum TaxID=357466 RepID=A0AAD4TGU5_9MAGN|nr:hypothetical protein MKW98_006223 [Papaver atlanticum]